jgi:hypothetical protein
MAREAGRDAETELVDALRSLQGLAPRTVFSSVRVPLWTGEDDIDGDDIGKFVEVTAVPVQSPCFRQPAAVNLTAHTFSGVVPSNIARRDSIFTRMQCVNWGHELTFMFLPNHNNRQCNWPRANGLEAATSEPRSGGFHLGRHTFYYRKQAPASAWRD